MQTHEDSDYADRFMERLGVRAERGLKHKLAQITAGEEGEAVLGHWEHDGIDVTKRPDDEQGILRISVGGGELLPVDVNYCVFRGDRTQCAFLLEKAARALRQGQADA